MSDITLHFGWLVLGGAVTLGAAGYGLIALVALGCAYFTDHRQGARRVACSAALAALGSLVIAVPAFALPATAGSDDIANYLLMAWVAVFLAGIVVIWRSGSRLRPSGVDRCN